MSAGRPRKYPPSKIEEIKHLFNLGWSVRQIANEVSVPKSTVDRIIKR